MEPIISPWFIYFLSFVNVFQILMFTFSGMAGGFFLVSLIGYLVCKFSTSTSSYDSDEEKENKLRKLVPDWTKTLKRAAIFTAIFSFLVLITPSRNTVIAMYVTKFVTVDNISKAIEAGGNFKDAVKQDIIEIVEAMKGERAQSEESKDKN